jgi:hypothetical protein
MLIMPIAWGSPFILNRDAAVCLGRESQKQSLPLELSLAVLLTENGKVGLAGSNTNGSFDLGPGRINTARIPVLSRELGVSPLTLASALLNEQCTNLAVLVYLLRKSINETRGDVWAGVGRFHSKTPSHAGTYQIAVARKLNQLRSEGVIFQ